MKIAFFWINKPERVTNVSDGLKNKEIVDTMIESVREWMPDAIISQISDHNTKRLKGVDEFISMNGECEYLMPARMLFQWKFLRTFCVEDEHVVFVDPDIVFQHGMEHVFEAEFDIGLTWRDNLGQLSENMPFNAGVVFARNNVGGRRFFEMAYNMLTTAPEQIKKWYGDQLAMYDIFGKARYKYRGESDIIFNTGNEILFKLFPCDEYNYSPQGDEMYRAMNNGENCLTIERLMAKKVVHFKGGLKDSMVEYWKRNWVD